MLFNHNKEKNQKDQKSKKGSGSVKKLREQHLARKLTFGQKAADAVARFGGSWVFVGVFFLFLFGWMILNTILLLNKGFDAYPYILLNLILSCLAAIQAPIILMSQNRSAERDRWRAELDYGVNRKAERENQQMQKDLESIKRMLYIMQGKKLKILKTAGQKAKTSKLQNKRSKIEPKKRT